MKKCVMILFASVLSLSLILSGFIGVVQADDLISTEDSSFVEPSLEDNFADNHVLVVLTREASLEFNTYTENSFSAIGCAKVTNLSDATGSMAQAAMTQASAALLSGYTTISPANEIKHAETIGNYKQILCLELAEPGKENVLAAIKLLMQRDDVLYAGPDYIMSINERDAYGTAETNSDISEEDKRWAVDKIKLSDAWRYTTGSSDVLVGILDSGINGTHPALVSNLDKALCYDFTSGSGIAEPNPVDGLTPTHGTGVAGIIGAQYDNAGSLDGVCQNVTMVSLKVGKLVSSNGFNIHMAWVISAIDYAADIGVDILNFSAGWDESDMEDPYYDYAVAAAIYNYPGLFVCAAGNKNWNNDEVYNWPSNYDFPNLISVGSSTADDTKANSSCYGSTTVDIFAPGEAVYSTSGGDGYSLQTGTSFATPYVTGVAALMLSVNPDLTPSELKEIILITVDPIDAFETLCVSGGRLNAYRAVLAALTRQ